MNITDFNMLFNVVLTLVPLIYSAFMFKKFKKEVYGSGEVFAFIHLILIGIFLPDPIFRDSLIFGIIAGSLLQPVIADSILTNLTLVYEQKTKRFIATPVWMSMLWGTALTQLSYLWLRLDSLAVSSDTATLMYILFVAICFIYFGIFELTVNNLTPWWRRKNCRQTLNVARYAIFAETLTAIELPFILDHMKSWKSIIHVSALGGVLIAGTFLISCVVSYDTDL